MTLETSKLFSNLAPAEWQALRQVAQERRFAAGQEIFKQGDPGDGLYVVREGAVEILAEVGPGQRRPLARAGPGEFFGEMALVEDRPRSACAVAVRDTVVDFIPREPLLRVVARSPVLALNLLREISRRLREFDRQYVCEVLQAERLALLGRFVHTIVHDLKNPLSIISLTAEMAYAPHASPELRQSARRRIGQQVERITDFINDLLDFTQTRGLIAEPAPTDYAVFVQHLVAEVQPELALRSVQLTLANAAPAVLVRLNPRRLRRVFFNLLHNAADAMAGGGKVTLRFDATPGEVVTAIRDTGQGIAPEIADQLFTPFVTFGKPHGSGLGLAICRKIVEEHGGRIWAQNDPAGGAVFAFALPIAK